MLAVCEAARNLACVGAKPLALTNCLNFGNPEKPHIYWQMENAIRGMAEAARVLDTPVVSGNVSLYNETAAGAIYPTPVVGMAGLLENIEQGYETAFKKEGDLVLLLGKMSDDLGASEYLFTCHGLEGGTVPLPDLIEEKNLIALLQSLHKERLLSSCHDISEGGMAVCLAESAIQGRIGFEINFASAAQRFEGLLFSEAPGRVVVSVRPQSLPEVWKLAQAFNIEVHELGQVGGRDMVIRKDGDKQLQLSVEEAAAIWEGTIDCVMK